ncbi:hypothetical protein RJT34_11123 [Clitoria ternatea]|uniref:Uncharacterized protein n=1 Tax=Clitoria ternatea TaxID=43366 RepID=A0AAN9JLC2_CLITE
MVRIPLIASGDTAFHVAMSANSNTSVEWVQGMIEKNQNLSFIHGHHDMLLVHLAASNGRHRTVQHLNSGNLLDQMTYKDIKRLFFYDHSHEHMCGRSWIRNIPSNSPSSDTIPHKICHWSDHILMCVYNWFNELLEPDQAFYVQQNMEFLRRRGWLPDNTDVRVTIPNDNQVQIIGKNGMPLELDQQRELKDKLYRSVINDEWDHEDLEMVRIPLTANGDTALHVAVIANRKNSVRKLVSLMTSKDLALQNKDGNTALCMAAISWNINFDNDSWFHDSLNEMIKKNRKLPLIPNNHQMLPVHLAASNGHRSIVQELTSEDLLDRY